MRIWDLDELAIKATYRELHQDKVQVVKWNRLNEQVFLSGGYDSKINIVDVRSDGSNVPSYSIPKSKYKDIESANWHHLTETNFVVTTESGHFLGFDTRQLSEPVFTV